MTTNKNQSQPKSEAFPPLEHTGNYIKFYLLSDHFKNIPEELLHHYGERIRSDKSQVEYSSLFNLLKMIDVDLFTMFQQGLKYPRPFIFRYNSDQELQLIAHSYLLNYFGINHSVGKVNKGYEISATIADMIKGDSQGVVSLNLSNPYPMILNPALDRNLTKDNSPYTTSGNQLILLSTYDEAVDGYLHDFNNTLTYLYHTTAHDSPILFLEVPLHADKSLSYLLLKMTEVLAHKHDCVIGNYNPNYDKVCLVNIEVSKGKAVEDVLLNFIKDFTNDIEGIRGRIISRGNYNG